MSVKSLIQPISFPTAMNVIWCDNMQADPGSTNPTTDPLKPGAKSCSQYCTRACWRCWESTRVTGHVTSGQSSTCLVLPPMEELVFFGVHGDTFPPVHPHPGPWAESHVSRSCPAVGSLFLMTHCSSWIPAEQLSVHLSTWHTGEALVENRDLRSQSKEEVDPGIELTIKSTSSRAWPILLPTGSI